MQTDRTSLLSLAEENISAPKHPYRLGLIAGDLTSRGPNGELVCGHAMGRLAESLRHLAPGMKVCLPQIDVPLPTLQHVLQFPSSDFTPLPNMGSTIQAQRYTFRVRRILRQFAAECDVLFVRHPFLVPRALLGLRKPIVVHVLADVRKIVAASIEFRGLMRWGARMFAADSERVIRKIIRRPLNRVVINGAEMWDRLGCQRGKVVVSSCIYRSEMRPRENLALHDPPRILFVGFFRPEKGVDVLLSAFEKVRSRRPLRLTIVGGSDRPGNAGEAAIHQAIESSPYRADIEQRGLIEFGEQLFDTYREHDLFVLASRSEGTPRTLVEARAFGCPIIATAVGGVPTSVSHEVDGLLIPSEDADAMAAAIERVLDDDGLRRKLIQGGLARAAQLSQENFAAQIIEEVDLAWQAANAERAR